MPLKQCTHQLATSEFTAQLDLDVEEDVAQHPGWDDPTSSYIPGYAVFEVDCRLHKATLKHRTDWPGDWEIGFYQVVRSLKRTMYRERGEFVTPPGKDKPKMVGCHYRVRHAQDAPCRDGPSTQVNRPWFNDFSTFVSRAGRVGFSATQIKSDHLRSGDTYKLKLVDAPGVRAEGEVQLNALKQEVSFGTYLLLLNLRLREGYTLWNWEWTADFTYAKWRPVPYAGGCVLTSHCADLVAHREYLPDAVPATFTDPVSKEVLAQQNAATPWPHGWVRLGTDPGLLPADFGAA